MKVSVAFLITFVAAFSLVVVIPVTFPLMGGAAIAAEREGVPGRRQSGGTR